MAAQAPERDHRASAAPSRARVLVVDDEPAMLRALRINLRVRKYDVTTAATGQEALTEAGRRPPDAVILDLGLPDVDGIEVIKRLRGWSRAPVIVLSGRAGPGDKIAALDAGADDYVTKPFSMEELLARLRAALRRDDTGPPPVRVRVGRREIAPAAAPAVTTAASDEPNGGVLVALPARPHESRQGLAGRPLVAWKPSPYRAHWYEQVNIVLAGRR